MSFFRNLPIKRKMSLAVLGVTTVALLVACGTFVVYERVSFRKAMARNLTVLADALAHISAGNVAFWDLQESTAADEEKALKALDADPAVTTAAVYNEEGAKLMDYARKGAAKDAPARAEQDGIRTEGDRMVIVRPVIGGQTRVGSIYLRADLAEVNSKLRIYVGISSLILLGSLLLAFALSTALQNLILRPIIALTTVANRISQTRDYTVRAEKLSGDELGVLTDAFNQMLGDIEERTSALQQANESMRVQSVAIEERTAALQKANESLQMQTGEMRDAATFLASSAGQIVTATRQLALSAADAATAVGQTTATVEEVRQTSQFSSERAKFVSDQAQNAAEVAKGGKRSVNQTIEGMNGIRAQMGEIAESILSLTAQSQAIGEIIASVDDLAAQSKLLAVNAAIEAAKAGDEGRGFSVVAQEVKSLAEQSKQATSQVRAILSDIQKATGRAVLSTEQGSKAVESGVRQSSAAGESINALADSIAEAAQAATQIAATSRQQFAGMEQVAAAMENIRGASTQTVASTQKVEAAAQQLNELGQKLQQLVERLKV